jgi:hypothetical protein
MKSNFMKVYEAIINESTEPTQEMKDWFEKRTNKHIKMVQDNWRSLKGDERFKAIFDDMWDPDYIEHILQHDKSKFQEPEYTPYIFITWKYKMEGEGKEFDISEGMTKATKDATTHHVFNNSHHPVYWDDSKKPEDNVINDKDRDKPTGEIVDATKMPNWAICEMLCDWYAVSQERNSSLKGWADMNVGEDKRWKFNEQQTKLIYDLVEFFEGE